MEFKKLEQDDYKALAKVIRKYSNLFKVLYQLDPAIASEFKKRQEAFHDESEKNHSHSTTDNHTHSSGSCCGSIDNQSTS